MRKEEKLVKGGKIKIQEKIELKDRTKRYWNAGRSL